MGGRRARQERENPDGRDERLRTSGLQGFAVSLPAIDYIALLSKDGSGELRRVNDICCMIEKKGSSEFV